jgi:glycosyltransferase involved in cell wall biosynthesis
VTQLIFAIPGDITTPTGGYAYDRRIMALLPDQGITPVHLPLPGSYPNPSPQDLVSTALALSEVPADAVLMIDGLALGAMPSGLLARVKTPVIALVHHPLGYESGLSDEKRAALIESERAILSMTKAVIATSQATADLLIAEFDVGPEDITVAEPGTDQRKRIKKAAAVKEKAAPLALLSVGAIVPRKGYDILVEALSGLSDIPWTLDIVGALDRAPAAVTALKAQIDWYDLNQRITLHGALSDAELDAKWRMADIFVLSSRFEGYGMVLAEAMAYGLPIITTTGGAAAQTVPDGAALKVPPDDVIALREALARMLGKPATRTLLANESIKASKKLPSWQDTATRIAETVIRVAREARESTS